MAQSDLLVLPSSAMAQSDLLVLPCRSSGACITGEAIQVGRGPNRRTIEIIGCFALFCQKMQKPMAGIAGSAVTDQCNELTPLHVGQRLMWAPGIVKCKALQA
jgi:hypothetical protein